MRIISLTQARLTLAFLTAMAAAAAIAAVVTWQVMDQGDGPATTSNVVDDDLRIRPLLASVVPQLASCESNVVSVHIPSFTPGAEPKIDRSASACGITARPELLMGEIVNLQGEWYYVSRFDGHQSPVKANP